MLSHLLILALRGLWRHRGTAAINLVALMLGLYAFLFAVALAVSIRNADNFWPNADRIVEITQQTTPAASHVTSPVQGAISFRAAPLLKAEYPQLEAVARLRWMGERPLIHGEKYAFPALAAVDEDFPRIFAWPLRQGDWKSALNRPDGIVLSPQIAQTLFGGDNALGATVSVQGRDLVVTGVLDEPAKRRSSQFDLQNIALTSRETGEFLDYHKQYQPGDWLEPWIPTFALLPPDLPIATFEQQLAGFGARHVPAEVAAIRFGAVPITKGGEIAVNSGMGTEKTGVSFVMLVLGLGFLVLFVACLNYANLGSAMATARLHEMGLRKLLGENSRQVLGQGLIEAALLTLCALAVLLLTLFLLEPVISRNPSLLSYRYLFEQQNIWPLSLLGVAAAALSGGLYPALVMARCRPVAVLQGGKGGARSSRLSAFLVALQFFTASFLLITALVIKDQNDMTRRLLTPEDSDIVLYVNTISDGRPFNALQAAVAPLAGVQKVSGRTARWPDQTIATLGRERQAGARFDALENGVGPDFFAAIGVKIIAGRDFSPDHADDIEPAADKKNGAVTNIVIDRTLAESFGWSPAAAIGQTLYDFGPDWIWQMTVVGVVEDRPISRQFGGTHGSFFHYQGDKIWFPLIRIARAHAAETTDAVAAAINRLTPGRPVKIESDAALTEGFRNSLTGVAKVFGELAAFTFAIAIIGLSGMAFHVTGRRTQEIGIRKILGASSATIVKLLVSGFARPVALATIASWPFAYLVTQTYLSLFVRHVALSGWPFLISLAVALAVAGAAVGLQTLRAARRHPAEILRHE